MNINRLNQLISQLNDLGNNQLYAIDNMGYFSKAVNTFFSVPSNPVAAKALKELTCDSVMTTKLNEKDNNVVELMKGIQCHNSADSLERSLKFFTKMEEICLQIVGPSDLVMKIRSILSAENTYYAISLDPDQDVNRLIQDIDQAKTGVKSHALVNAKGIQKQLAEQLSKIQSQLDFLTNNIKNIESISPKLMPSLE